MALATRTIAGNNSGLLPRRPKIVVMHSTRSGRVSFTDVQELGATINWFLNPAGTSAHWIISKLERIRAVADALIAWHATLLNAKSWAIEFTQPTIDRTFGKGHYDNAALIGRHYVKLGVKPVWLGDWDGNLTQSGFVDHEDTVQGRASGKSDIGHRFDRPRFIASLEVDMPLNTADKTWLKAMVLRETNAALVNTDKAIAAIQKSLRGGDLSGIYVRAKGQKTVYFVEYVGGALVRHHVQNIATYVAIGGAGTGVIEVSVAQVEKMVLGPKLPDLKV